MSTCLAGVEGCTCCTEPVPDYLCDLLDIPRGLRSEFCKCHDCYTCGQMDCGVHT
jgi:hypothetical protein